MNIERSSTQLYAELVDLEQLPAQPDEMLTLGPMPVSSYEYEALATSGVSEAELNAGQIIRGKLLDAGFVFRNHLGNGEKPIINSSTHDKNGTPLSERLLLTADELASIQHDQLVERQEAGLNAESLEVVRERMVHFLLGSVALHRSRPVRAADLFKEAQAHIVSSCDHGSYVRVAALFQRIIESDTLDPSLRLHFLMDQCLANIDIDFVNNIPVTTLPIRFNALRGIASPFLDSGFRFNTNYDVTMFPNQPAQTRRLNIASIHLLSRGIDEIGGSCNGSHDQTYVTATEFKTMMETVTEPVTTHDQQVELIAQRLIAATSE